MGKISYFSTELKRELKLYYKDNKSEVLGCVIGLASLLVAFFVIVALVTFPKVLLTICLGVVIGIGILANEVTTYDFKGCMDYRHNYYKYKLLYDIKFLCIRFIAYPIVVSTYVFLIYCLFFK